MSRSTDGRYLALAQGLIPESLASNEIYSGTLTVFNAITAVEIAVLSPRESVGGVPERAKVFTGGVEKSVFSSDGKRYT